MSLERMITAPQAAARLGVKRQTLYAYVSRGLLHRQVAMDGRSSLFDPDEIESFRLTRVDREDGELRALIATAVTRVHDDALLVRGRDLVELIDAGMTFPEIADLVWQATDDERGWPDFGSTLDAMARDDGLTGIDALRVVVARASAVDPLRHDLSSSSVTAAGRRMITAMVLGLDDTRSSQPADAALSARSTPPPAGSTLADVLWHRLSSRRSNQQQRQVLDVSLSLLADHGLAGSTFAARIAASVRADPYSVVSAGLGVVGGVLHGAASADVHELFAAAESLDDPAGALGEALRRTGRVPGFGHSIYTRQDPRFAALMVRITKAWSSDPRLVHIHKVRDLVSERREELPNIDLALGAMTWLAGMDATAGETIFAIARTAGWLAHAMEEYDEKPLRFRPRARYTGTGQ